MFLLVIWFFFIFLKSTRLVFFFVWFEIVCFTFSIFFVSNKDFFLFYFFFLGVLSSISSLMILKLLVISYGSDYVFF
uniref:NADH dehydrogenase subunit 4L n=1 Tax=Pratylenchus vulnus TaxID=45931 RepID=M1E1L2_PRAVU|nr:NADH dehydrogenase subunit 4L [Pratylenchus vulnus]